MSKKAITRLAFLVSTTSVKFESMMTLTYNRQFPIDGREAKKHLNAFLTQMRRLFTGFDYVWFVEFQRRGAPHFHILTNIAEPRLNGCFMEEFADIWTNILCPHELLYSDITTRKVQSLNLQTKRVHLHRKAWEAIREENGAARYAIKYATKPWQKEVPSNYKNMGRFWGASHRVKNQKQPCTEIDVGGDAEAGRLAERYRPGVTDKFDVLPQVIFTAM